MKIHKVLQFFLLAKREKKNGVIKDKVGIENAEVRLI